MLKLEGQVAVVTGGAGGIGNAICQRLAADGAAVAVVGLDLPAAQAVADDLEFGGIGVACDISAAHEVRAMVDSVMGRFGRIDILVNNAGVMRNGPFLDMADDSWDSVLATNLTGPFAVTRAVGAVMRNRGYGRITFVSSLAAAGNRNQANYAAAKAGIGGLAKTVALELGEFGITCNVVAPGRIDTDMLRTAIAERGLTWEQFEATAFVSAAIKRVGQVEDIAAAVAFFSYPESGFITGQTLYATGNPVA